MKKLITAMLMATLICTACGGSTPTETTTPVAEVQTAAAAEAQTTEAATTEAPTEETKGDIYFDGDTIKIVDGELTIKDVEIVDPDTSWGEETKKIVITYEFTNTNSKGEPLMPWSFWTACFKVTQEDENAVYDLEAGITPDSKSDIRDNDFVEVKVGGTMTAVTTYLLKFEGEPVKITASQGMMGDVLGEKIVETK